MSSPHRPIAVVIDRRPGPDAAASTPSTGRTPPIDIFEDADGLVLEADVPGATEEGVAIRVVDNLLSLRADVRPTLPEGVEPVRLESPLGPFLRTFILSDEVDRAGITAELRSGVLRILMPKAERPHPRRIDIESHEE